jgi:hypothetical protein
MITSSVYLWDEDREWIPLASTIRFDPENLNLPIQGRTHPVLPAYMMRLGTLLWGENPLGFRFFSMLAGVLTVLVAYRLARQAGGPAAGLATALLLALNEYHVVMSSVAVDGVFFLFFTVLAIGAFMKFLQTPGGSALILTGLLTGLAYLCNERALLLLPVWGTVVLLKPYRPWLRRWPTWVAVLLFFLVISPDLLKGWVENTGQAQAAYSDHLARVSGFGITPQPLAFFGKTALTALLAAFGLSFKDWAPEYPAMNELFGAAMLLGILVILLTRELRSRTVVRLWLAIFFLAFIVLSFLDTKYDESSHLGPQAWYWMDITLLPAALLAGTAIGFVHGWHRRVLVLLILGGCLVSLYQTGAGRLGLQRFKAGAEPLVLWPADGRSVEVRTGFLPCVTCDQAPEVRLERVSLEIEGTSREARSDEFEPVDPPAGRHLRLMARREVRWYGLHYRLREASGRETPVTVYVLVRDEPQPWPPMFWVADAVSRSSTPWTHSPEGH